jgi:hypothetical protein
MSIKDFFNTHKKSTTIARAGVAGGVILGDAPIIGAVLSALVAPVVAIAAPVVGIAAVGGVGYAVYKAKKKGNDGPQA